MFLISLLLILAIANSHYTSPPIVTTSLGRIQGVPPGADQSRQANSFYGIPYASAPIGPLRFRPPTPPSSWNDTLDATSVGKSCMQPFGDGFISVPPWMEELLERSPLMEPMSEDCMYLNVFSPSLHDATQPPLSVLVWLHGGSYLGGSGELQSGYPFYDMRKLAASSTGAVVVSVNYRLGVFGFLSDDQLLKESGTSGTRPPEPPRHLAWRPR